jgi:hypothetical protein
MQYMLVSRHESAGPWQACQEALLPRVLVVPLGAAVRSAWIWLTG